MKDLILLASEIQQSFSERNWKFCFIGGIALLRWGEPRLTLDIDISLFTGFGNEESYIDLLIAQYKSRISNAKEFALSNRVLLLQSEDGIGIDIALAGLPFEKQIIENSSIFEFTKDCKLLTCSPDDLIILKAFADRYKDWADIESIIKTHKDLNQKYILKYLKPLCKIKESPEILKKLKDLFKKFLNN